MTDLPVVMSWDLDENDVIVATGGDWDTFAQSHGGSDTVRAYVVGRQLWGCISDSTMRHLYQALHERVRATKTGLSFPIACATDNGLYIGVGHLDYLGEGRVRYRSIFDRREPPPPTNDDGGAPDSEDEDEDEDEEFTRMCSWCKRLMTPRGWMLIEDALPLLGFYTLPTWPRITHSICKTCADDFEKWL